MACKAAMAFLCLTMQACGGMHRKGGEEKGRTGAGAVKKEGRSGTGVFACDNKKDAPPPESV